MSTTSLLIIALTFVLAGIVKGVTGMGLPTVAMGVLAAFMPPVSAASLLLVPSLLTNVWQLAAGPSVLSLVVRLWPMMLGIFVGIAAGSRVLRGTGTALASALLGLALTAYAVYGLMLRPLSIRPRMERWLSPVIGLATGLVAGATGLFAIPAVPYLQGLGLSREELIQALGLSFTVSTLALALMLAQSIPPAQAAASAAAALPALAGLWMGTVLRRWISPAAFRRVFLYGLAMLGLELLVRAVLREF